MQAFTDHQCHADYEDLRRRGIPGITTEELTFSIMHGNGNVIMVVDEARSGIAEPVVGPDLARELCGAFRSVRVDGIAFIRSSSRPIRMTYFERDGTHSQMCGNALRCVTYYGTEHGYLHADSDVISTDDGPKWVSTADGTVRVAIGPGREFQRVAADRYFVFSGLPHLVLLLDDRYDLQSVDVKSTGGELRYDEQLCRQLNHPEGLHVDFVHRHHSGIQIRTYEVGVEDETNACGTGAAASAFVAHQVWQQPYPITVIVPGGLMKVDDAEQGLIISGTIGHLFTTVAATHSR